MLLGIMGTIANAVRELHCLCLSRGAGGGVCPPPVRAARNIEIIFQHTLANIASSRIAVSFVSKEVFEVRFFARL